MRARFVQARRIVVQRLHGYQASAADTRLKMSRLWPGGIRLQCLQPYAAPARGATPWSDSRVKITRLSARPRMPGNREAGSAPDTRVKITRVWQRDTAEMISGVSGRADRPGHCTAVPVDSAEMISGLSGQRPMVDTSAKLALVCGGVDAAAKIATASPAPRAPAAPSFASMPDGRRGTITPTNFARR